MQKLTGIGILIGVFIMIVIGLNLMTTTANNITELTQVTNISNSSFTSTNNTHISLGTNVKFLRQNTVFVYNKTTGGQKLIEGKDYSVNYLYGTINVSSYGGVVESADNCAGCSNQHRVYYEYDNSVITRDSASMSMINLIMIFFALGVISIAVLSFKDQIADWFN